ncbi:fish-egg lectin-like [Brachyistius frenatus]|uniref:fish-egg lectin-like n=1 Tax=Brachyistius frenatus TaxID=100188 RepID=UPI0037E90ACE
MKAYFLVLCCLAVSHAWTCNEGPRLNYIVQIDAGQGKVVARDISNYAYFLVGSSWSRLGYHKFKHVSVGPAGLWAADTSNRVNKFISGNFRPTTGVTMKQVDAGGNGQIVGVASSSYHAYCLRSSLALAYKGTGSLSWYSLSNFMKYISCGPLYGCWGIHSNSRIYHTQKLTPTTCGNARWKLIQGAAVMIEVATDGTVFVLNSAGQVFQRTGISAKQPAGTRWSNIPMCMPVRSLSYDLGTLWVVTRSRLLLKCTH